MDSESAARWLLEHAGFDPDETPPPLAVVADAHGITIVPAPNAGLPGDAALIRGCHGWEILVRPRLARPRLRHAVAHELVEYATGGSDGEEAANAGAAAVLAPRGAFRRALRVEGADYVALAERFGMTPTSAALRHAEIAGLTLAVVTRSGHVFARGEWPGGAEQARQLARIGEPHAAIVPLPGGRLVVIPRE